MSKSKQKVKWWPIFYGLIMTWKENRSINNFLRNYNQHAKKVVFDSPGLVDFAIGLVNPAFNLPEAGRASDVFWGIRITEELWNQPVLLVTKLLRQDEMTSGLVNGSFNLSKWQAVKLIFFAPCIIHTNLKPQTERAAGKLE